MRLATFAAAVSADAGPGALLSMPAVDIDDDDFLDYDDNDHIVVALVAVPTTSFAPALTVTAIVLTAATVSPTASIAASISSFTACEGRNADRLIRNGGCSCLVRRCHICRSVVGGQATYQLAQQAHMRDQ